jgi:hypothetical protein
MDLGDSLRDSEGSRICRVNTWEHLNESSQARNWSFEERGRRKEPEEVFLQI